MNSVRENFENLLLFVNRNVPPYTVRNVQIKNACMDRPAMSGRATKTKQTQSKLLTSLTHKLKAGGS